MDEPIRSGGNLQAPQSQEDYQTNRPQRLASKPLDVPHLGPLPPFFTIGVQESSAVAKAMRKPLSGYLGGVDAGGYWIETLKNKWCETFKCKFAIPCNSATSGLLAACMAIGVGPGDTIWTSAYTMSATAACGKVLGANIACIDIETLRFSMNMNLLTTALPKCIIVTNLFGHPAYLAAMRTWCDSNKVWMIEDNAQSPFATENGKYAGTIGHIGVFSLNVHKHIQAGEGGVIVTDSAELAEAAQRACNHGELYPDMLGQSLAAGLNLRMSEPTAAIACVQLERAKAIIAGRIVLALELSDMFAGIPWIRPPVQDIGCKHVYYMWAAIVTHMRRDELASRLNAHGMPMRKGYSRPLNQIFWSGNRCPVAEQMEGMSLLSFEVCAYDPSWRQRKTMREIVKRVVGSFYEDSRQGN